MNDLVKFEKRANDVSVVVPVQCEEMILVDGGGSLLDQLIEVVKTGYDLLKNTGPRIT